MLGVCVVCPAPVGCLLGRQTRGYAPRRPISQRRGDTLAAGATLTEENDMGTQTVINDCGGVAPIIGGSDQIGRPIGPIDYTQI